MVGLYIEEQASILHWIVQGVGAGFAIQEDPVTEGCRENLADRPC